jgi:RNA polymerase sigma-70 factor (ECF subfamily)
VLGDRFEPTLARARAADLDAFGELWRDAHPMLLRYLVVTAGAQAEDVASQTWIRVIESLGRFEGNEAQFRRWLVTIARNLHIDQVRRSTRRGEVLVEDLTGTRQDSVPDAGTHVEERLSTAAALELIRRLPPAQAEMVTLRVVVGLDVADVAAIVGRTPGAVRVAVHRGLRSLERTLTGSTPDRVTPTGLDSFFGHDA